MRSRPRISRGLLATAMGRFLGIGSFAVATSLISLNLNLEGAGALLFVQAICGTLAVVIVFGEDRYATLLFARSNARTWRQVLQFWLESKPWVRMARGLAVAIMAIVLWVQLPSPLESISVVNAFVYTSLISVALGLQKVLSEALRAGGHVFHANLGTGRTGGVVTQLVFVALLAANLILKGRGSLTFEMSLLMLLVSAIVGCAHLVIAFVVVGEPRGDVTDDLELSSIEHSPVATLLAAGTGVLFAQVDMLIAGSLLGPASLGVYGITRRLAVIINTPGYVANLVVVRRVAASLTNGERSKLSSFLPRVSAAAAALALAATIVLVLAPAWAYLLLVPEEWISETRYVLAALSIGQILNVASGACGTVLLLAGHQRRMVGAAVAALLVLGILGIFMSSGSALMLAFITSGATGLYFGSLAHSARRCVGVTTDMFGLVAQRRSGSSV